MKTSMSPMFLATYPKMDAEKMPQDSNPLCCKQIKNMKVPPGGTKYLLDTAQSPLIDFACGMPMREPMGDSSCTYHWWHKGLPAHCMKEL